MVSRSKGGLAQKRTGTNLASLNNKSVQWLHIAVLLTSLCSLPIFSADLIASRHLVSSANTKGNVHIQSALPFVFADDTKCLLAIKSAQDIGKLQSDVNNTAMWSHSTDLLFNEAKFVHVRFWAKPPFDLDTTTYTVNGNPIKQLLQHKDLGVIFPYNLNHYKTITTKAYQILGLIRRTFRVNCIEAKKQLYISLVRSQIM